MRTSIDRSGLDVAELTPLVRRVVGRRLHDRDAADDLTQETLSRVLAAGPCLEPDALAAYAVVTARNLVAKHAQREVRWSKRLPAALDLRTPPRPDELAVEADERRALAVALERLRADERDELVAHEVHGIPTAELAAAAGTSPGSIAARLARTRAKLRVDYVLALRRVDPPTPSCRPVLVSLSAGDQRRQTALGAAGHLATCEACGDLAEPLLHRRRGAALVPLALLGRPGGWFARQWVDHPFRSSSITMSVAGGAAVVLLSGGGSPAPAPAASAPAPSPTTAPPAPSTAAPPSAAPPRADLVVGGRAVLDLTEEELATFEGAEVEARDVAIQDTAADEGFWVGTGQADRIWVQLDGGGESPVDADVGQVATFRGRLVRHGADYPALVGVDAAEGAAQLAGQPFHVEVAQEGLTVEGADLPEEPVRPPEAEQGAAAQPDSESPTATSTP